jgi:hypothetical protein
MESDLMDPLTRTVALSCTPEDQCSVFPERSHGSRPYISNCHDLCVRDWVPGIGALTLTKTQTSLFLLMLM